MPFQQLRCHHCAGASPYTLNQELCYPGVCMGFEEAPDSPQRLHGDESGSGDGQSVASLCPLKLDANFLFWKIFFLKYDFRDSLTVLFSENEHENECVIVEYLRNSLWNLQSSNNYKEVHHIFCSYPRGEHTESMRVSLHFWLNNLLLNWNVVSRHCIGFWGHLKSLVLRQLEPPPPRLHRGSLTSMSGRIFCSYLSISFVFIMRNSWIPGTLLFP